MAQDRGSVMTRPGVSAPPRHDAWIDPSPAAATPQSADRGLVFAMIALYLAGVALTCWYLFVS